MINAFGAHIQVRDESKPDQTSGQHAIGGQKFEQSRTAAFGHVDKHDIGFSRTHAQSINALQTRGEALGIGVVVGQARDVVLERMAGFVRSLRSG